MNIENSGSRSEKPTLDKINHALHRLSFVDRIGNHRFGSCGQTYSRAGFLAWYAVRWVCVVWIDDDICIDDVLFKPDKSCGVSCDL